MPVTATEVEALGAHSLDRVAPFPLPGAGEWYTEQQVAESGRFMNSVCACWKPDAILSSERIAEGPQVLPWPDPAGRVMDLDLACVRDVACRLIHTRFIPTNRGFTTKAQQKAWVSELILRLLLPRRGWFPRFGRPSELPTNFLVDGLFLLYSITAQYTNLTGKKPYKKYPFVGVRRLPCASAYRFSADILLCSWHTAYDDAC